MRGGGAGVEGEDTGEDSFACQRLLYCRMGDPTHVHYGGGCTWRGTKEHNCLKYSPANATFCCNK